MSTTAATCDYAVICSGAPKRGMGELFSFCFRQDRVARHCACWANRTAAAAVSSGWYHAAQLLSGEIQGARLSDVVEPWFLGGGAGTPGCAEFDAWRIEAEAQGVRFCASIADLPSAEAPRVALIAGRASDCPALFEQALGAGVSHIFLEKPGAPTVAALEGMAKQTEAAGVPVSMGYNKNVTKYVAEARAAEATAGDGASTKFIHNNAYAPEELDECFQRNAEGMLKNMAVHELALAVTYYGVTAENIASVVADKDYSVCEERVG